MFDSSTLRFPGSPIHALGSLFSRNGLKHPNTITPKHPTPMPPSLTATRIMVDVEEQTFSIDWTDGHQTVYPLDGLRRACPCATCQGHARMSELPDPNLFRLPSLMRWTALKVEPAGSIGLRLIWDDGHSTGIYSWERLRAMCPCPVCAPG